MHGNCWLNVQKAGKWNGETYRRIIFVLKLILYLKIRYPIEKVDTNLWRNTYDSVFHHVCCYHVSEDNFGWAFHITVSSNDLKSPQKTLNMYRHSILYTVCGKHLLKKTPTKTGEKWEKHNQTCQLTQDKWWAAYTSQ